MEPVEESKIKLTKKVTIISLLPLILIIGVVVMHGETISLAPEKIIPPL
jgi:hypothetical protein